ncbi:MAG TPA: hypothetical protein VMR33_12935 [Candidatus Baltobacteraceae bacterium]|nr:hypothetical protein [Candidatus Baltobacteraceae bacterium]
MIGYPARFAILVGLAASLLLCPAPCAWAGPGAAFLDPTAFTSLGVFNPETNVVVDVDSGQMSGGASFTGVNVTQAGFPLWVFTFSSFTLNSGLTVTITNDGPDSPGVAFLSQRDMTIAGAIHADGEVGSAALYGNGAGAGSNGETNTLGGDGGGGGGYGGMGGPGDGGTTGGGTYNTDLSAQLAGGSGGGTGGASLGGPGGLGGGALQIAALGSLTLSGTISADGGAGAMGQLSINTPGGSGGGGSGGGLLVQAGKLTVNSNAVLSAIGGDGGPSYVLPLGHFNFAGGGGGGGGGRIVVAFPGAGITGGSFAVSGGSSGYGFSGDGAPGTVNFVQSSLVPAIPSIAASPGTSGNIVISWPSYATNYALQTSAALGGGAVWNTVTGAVVVGNNFVLTNQALGVAGFFRLTLQ